jgi:hypothetical protein
MTATLETVLKRFEEPDEIRTFEKGKFELVHVGGMTLGRATYEPGWKWSEHVGPSVGASRCNCEHVGMVISGCATAAMEDGTIQQLSAGTIFYIPPGPPGHDSWVVGHQRTFRCTSLALTTMRRSSHIGRGVPSDQVRGRLQSRRLQRRVLGGMRIN